MHYSFHPYLFNPLYWHLRNALRNDQIRYIFFYGGSSAAKTHTIAQALSVEAVENRASSMILRKFGVDIEDSVWGDFKEVGTRLRINEVQAPVKRNIRYSNGAVNRFRGLDESEKLKGLKGFKYLYYNELSLFDHADLKQGRKRLRGMPGQKIIADWNPIIQTHWIKTEVLDKELWQDLSNKAENAPTKYCELERENSFVKINASGNMLLIKTTYKDNFWVVGHPSEKPAVGFLDKHVIADFEHDKVHAPNDYRIYGLGEWGLVRTGSEFWKNFDESRDVKALAIQQKPLHIALDDNYQPYVTLSVWQVNIEARQINQVYELPCKHPDNNAPKTARKFIDWITKIGFTDMVYVYGDPAGNAHSTKNEDGKSFFDKFFDELRSAGVKFVNRVEKAHPAVAMSAAFINDIYESHLYGWSIIIGQNCRVSIDDYCMTKENMDGGVDKKKTNDKELGVSYEKYGHFSDAKRYFITTLLKAEFLQYKNRRKRVGSFAA